MSKRKFATLYLNALSNSINVTQEYGPVPTTKIEDKVAIIKEWFADNKDTVFFFAITNSQRKKFREVMEKLDLSKYVRALNKASHTNPNTRLAIFMYVVDQMPEEKPSPEMAPDFPRKERDSHHATA